MHASTAKARRQHSSLLHHSTESSFEIDTELNHCLLKKKLKKRIVAGTKTALSENYCGLRAIKLLVGKWCIRFGESTVRSLEARRSEASGGGGGANAILLRWRWGADGPADQPVGEPADADADLLVVHVQCHVHHALAHHDLGRLPLLLVLVLRTESRGLFSMRATCGRGIKN